MLQQIITSCVLILITKNGIWFVGPDQSAPSLFYTTMFHILEVTSAPPPLSSTWQEHSVPEAILRATERFHERPLRKARAASYQSGELPKRNAWNLFSGNCCDGRRVGYCCEGRLSGDSSRREGSQVLRREGSQATPPCVKVLKFSGVKVVHACSKLLRKPKFVYNREIGRAHV